MNTGRMASVNRDFTHIPLAHPCWTTPRTNVRRSTRVLRGAYFHPGFLHSPWAIFFVESCHRCQTRAPQIDVIQDFEDSLRCPRLKGPPAIFTQWEFGEVETRRPRGLLGHRISARVFQPRCKKFSEENHMGCDLAIRMPAYLLRSPPCSFSFLVNLALDARLH